MPKFLELLITYSLQLVDISDCGGKLKLQPRHDLGQSGVASSPHVDTGYTSNVERNAFTWL
jgi:hypothetical protein